MTEQPTPGTMPSVKGVLLSPQRAFGERPLLVLGPSLGTSTILWNTVAPLLGDRYDIVAWDLPGHGISPVPAAGFGLPALADAVVALVDSVAPGARFHYAGVSVGGATGLHLALAHPDRVKSLAVLCSGAKLGTAEGWQERAETVRKLGTAVMIQGSAERWFAPGFMDRQPDVASRLLHSLRDADRFGYAFVCEALAGHDVRAQLGNITVPTLAVAGIEDVVAPPPFAEEVADGITSGGGAARAVPVAGVGHLAPAEDPATVAGLLAEFMEENSK